MSDSDRSDVNDLFAGSGDESRCNFNVFCCAFFKCRMSHFPTILLSNILVVPMKIMLLSIHVK